MTKICIPKNKLEIIENFVYRVFSRVEKVYSTSDTVTKLIAEAKAIIEQKPVKLHDFQIELEKYFIDDYYKDLEDTVLNDDFVGASVIRGKIINRSMDIFFKTQQIRRNKDKRLAQQLHALKPTFRVKIENALAEKWNELEAMEKLRLETETFLGGRRDKTWILRSRLDLG